MISEKHIMSLVKKFADSPEGKAAIKKNYGIEYDSAPLRNFKTKFKFYGERMKRILFLYVHSVIDSISLEDIVVGEPAMDENGNLTLKISFIEDALHRESLDPDAYPAGLDDVVLLFSCGLHAKRHTYGLWRRPSFNGGYYKQVISRKDRDPDDFLKNAVREFNTASEGFAVASLIGDYDRK